jgi:hypothetical protein
MTHSCCPNCRLRFTHAAAAYMAACPQCGDPPQPMAALEGAVGYRLFTLDDDPQLRPEAIAVSMPIPDPGRRRP